MSRVDFIKIANVVAAKLWKHRTIREQCLVVMCDAFQACNKRFDREIFVEHVNMAVTQLQEEYQAQCKKMFADLVERFLIESDVDPESMTPIPATRALRELVDERDH